MNTITYRARWIIPVTTPPIQNGRMSVQHGRIASIEPAAQGTREVDLGDVALLPGFVNAHTHLELSVCRGRVPYRGSFVTWIRDLLRALQSQPQDASGSAFGLGERESLAAGVTALADIGHGPQGLDAWRAARLSVTGFLEVLGMGPRRHAVHERSLAGAMAVYDSAAEPRPHQFGLSPHAPYSTDTSVYRSAIQFCRTAGRPLCTHLAETREEQQFLRDGTGPFRELLESGGLWDDSFVPPGCSPVAYAQQLGLLDTPSLLAHVNYASDDDLDRLARGQASVAYCPRTHRFFEHEPHRHRDMLARGVNVCLGTDSLASNETLSILDELRFLRQIDRHSSNEQLLAMGTIAGARALGQADELGSLDPGKRADFVVLPLDNPATRDPLGDLLESRSAVTAVYLAGEPEREVRTEGQGD